MDHLSKKPKIENYTSLYNTYGIITEGVSLDENNQVLVSPQLVNDGWKTGLTFQEGSDDNQAIAVVLDEIKTRSPLYEIKIGFIKDGPFSKTRCLLLKEKDL